MNTLYRWLNANKEKDSGLINFLKFLYSIGKIDYLHSIVDTALGIMIPLLIGKECLVWAIVLSIILIAEIIFNYICNNYQKRQFVQRRFSSEVLSNQSSLMNSVIIEIQSNSGWKRTIFKKISDLVCEKIHNVFKDILKCETRVSVEYIFHKNKNGKSEKHVKMAARRSPNRDTCRGAVTLESKKKYYSYKIFKNNNEGINILSHDEIRDVNIWYKNPAHDVNVKQYIGIAVSVINENVSFILQIDCLDDIIIGNNNTDEEIVEFINQYLKAYINIASFSYLMNLDKNKQIPEV